MFRKLGLFLAASVLVLLLFMTVFTTAAVVVFKPSNLKQWLNKSEVYDTIVHAVLEENRKLQQGTGDESIPINDPKIQAIAEQAFSPQFLQDSAEKVIDGVDAWLAGDSEIPEFAVNIGQAKKAFAQGIGDYAISRYEALPACKPGQEPKSMEIFEINCRPAGYNPKPAIEKAVYDLQNNKDFLPDETLTFNSLDKNNELKQNIDAVPRWYQRGRWAPLILGIITIVAILGVIFLSPSRRQGLKRVMGSLYLVVGFLLFYLWFSSYVLTRATRELLSRPEDSQSMQQVGVNILKQMQVSAGRAVLPFIIGFALIAIGISIYLFLTRDKSPKAKGDSADDNTTPLEDTAKEQESLPSKPPSKPKSPKLVQ